MAATALGTSRTARKQGMDDIVNLNIQRKSPHGWNNFFEADANANSLKAKIANYQPASSLAFSPRGFSPRNMKHTATTAMSKRSKSRKRQQS
jgi:hypothetical protein